MNDYLIREMKLDEVDILKDILYETNRGFRQELKKLRILRVTDTLRALKDT